jgi:FAD synthase
MLRRLTKELPSLLQRSPSWKIVCHCVNCKNAIYGASTKIVFLKSGIPRISTLDVESTIYRIRIDCDKARQVLMHPGGTENPDRRAM